MIRSWEECVDQDEYIKSSGVPGYNTCRDIYDTFSELAGPERTKAETCTTPITPNDFFPVGMILKEICCQTCSGIFLFCFSNVQTS